MKTSQSLSSDNIEGIYRHYKGALYQVLLVAKHTELESWHVVYKSLEDQQIWVRPYDMFTEKVVVEGSLVQRFEKVS